MRKTLLMSRKRLFMSMIMVFAIAMATLVSIALVFAANMQDVSTTIKINYVIDGVGVKISATYSEISDGTTPTKTSITTAEGKSELEFKVSDELDLSEVSLNDVNVTLNENTKKVIYEYKFTSTSDGAFTIKLDNTNLQNTSSIQIRYKVSKEEIDATTYAVQSFDDATLMAQGVVENGRTIYIYISVELLDTTESTFEGEFNWELSDVEESELLTINFDNGEGTGGQTTQKIIAADDVAMPIIYDLPSLEEHMFAGYYTVDGNTKYINADGTSAHVADLQDGDTLYASFENVFIYDGAGTTIIGLTDYGKNLHSLTVPSGIIAIGDNAFEGSVASSIEFEENIAYADEIKLEQIGNNAFLNCINLEKIEIPDSVTSIGASAFSGCNSLTSMTFPYVINGVFNTLFGGTTNNDFALIPTTLTDININGGTIIPDKAFYMVSSIKCVTITEGLTSIGMSAFFSCTGLQKIIIPASVETIKIMAFLDCRSLVQVKNLSTKVDLSDSSLYTLGYAEVLTDADSDFNSTIEIVEQKYKIFTYEDNKVLVKLVDDAEKDASDIPDDVTIIGYHALYNSSITSIELPTSLKTLWWGALRNCEGLKGNLSLPKDLTTIDDYAIDGCSGLSGLTISENSQLTNIGWYAFRNCISITEIELPSSVETIESYAFQGCNSLAKLTFPYAVKNENGELDVFATLFSSINNEIPESLTNININGGTIIPDKAFNNCTNIQNLTICEGITSIGESAFSGCTSLTSSLASPLILPDSLITLEDCAFYGCEKLESIDIKECGIETIGTAAFSSCLELKNITLPDNLKIIEGDAFSFCNSLTEITIPSSVTDILGWAFAYCLNLSSLTILENSQLENIGERVFFDCSGLTGDLTIPDSVTSIGEYAFSGCSKLTGDLIIPDSVISIGNSAFSGCSGFNGALTLPTNQSFTSIENLTFYGCINLTGALTIPNSVTSIGASAFAGCSGFNRALTLPINQSFTSIGNSAFFGCSGLIGTLTIPNSVTSIGYSAFKGCNGFDGALILPTNQSFTSISELAFYNCSGLTGVTIPSNVTSIGKNAFYNCSGLTGDLIIPDSVTSIGDSAFAGCSGFDGALTLPTNQNFTSISEDAFFGCSGLTGTLTIPNSVTSIGEYAFYNCSGLTGSLTIPDSVISIGEYAFRDCSGLSKVSIQSSEISVGKSVFCNCSSLTEMVFTYCESIGAFYTFFGIGASDIPKSLKIVTISGGAIPANAFENCSLITTVSIASSVTSIGASAFSGCSSLIAMSLPYNENMGVFYTLFGSSVSSVPTNLIRIIIKGGTIPANAFENCSQITTISIDRSVTSIGASAFKGCNAVQTMIFPYVIDGVFGSLFGGGKECSDGYNDGDITYVPESLTNVVINGGSSIYQGAFYNCSYIESISIANSITSIPGMAFYSCDLLTQITIPDSVTSIGDEAFKYCSSLTNITIPSSVETIGNYAFDCCYKLVQIRNLSEKDLNSTFVSYAEILENNNQFTSILETINSKYIIFTTKDKTQKILLSTVDKNIQSANDSVLDSININKIGQYAFEGCSSLTQIAIPSSVTSIGMNAFSGCSGLTGDLTIPNSVTSIGGSAFSNCSGLSKIILSNRLTTIESATFNNCSSMTEIELPSSVTSIEHFAFNGCSSLTQITIPSSVTYIGFCAFQGCVKLSAITFNTTTGWFYAETSDATSGTAITVTSPSTNATNLKTGGIWIAYYLKRK